MTLYIKELKKVKGFLNSMPQQQENTCSYSTTEGYLHSNFLRHLISESGRKKNN